MKILSKQASRKICSFLSVILLLTAMSLMVIVSGTGCGEKEPDPTTQEGRDMYAGEYVHPNGSIILNKDGTYTTMNIEGRTTGGTYVLDFDKYPTMIYFYQTSPEEVTGEATIVGGVLTNAYGQFIKK